MKNLQSTKPNIEHQPVSSTSPLKDEGNLQNQNANNDKGDTVVQMENNERGSSNKTGKSINQHSIVEEEENDGMVAESMKTMVEDTQ